MRGLLLAPGDDLELEQLEGLLGLPVAAAPIARRGFAVLPEPGIPPGATVVQRQPDPVLFPLDELDTDMPRLRGQAPQTRGQVARDLSTAGDLAGASGGVTRAVRAPRPARAPPTQEALLEAPPGRYPVTDDMLRVDPDRRPADPSFVGRAPDRSGGDIARYRPAPHNVSQRLETSIGALEANQGGMLDDMRATVRRGLEIGGRDWYNAEELRSWFIASHGGNEQAGQRAWREFIELIGAGSTGAKVPENIRIASYYFNRGPEWIRQNAEGLLQRGEGQLLPPAGFGHKMQRNHAANVARSEAADIASGVGDNGGPSMSLAPWAARRANQAPMQRDTLNEKPLGFVASLLGNGTNIAADLHFTRYLGLASRDARWLANDATVSDAFVEQLRRDYGPRRANAFLTQRVAGDGKTENVFRARDFAQGGRGRAEEARRVAMLADEPRAWVGVPTDAEYGRAEQFVGRLAREMGLSPAQFQAALWMGAADRTGLAQSSRGTLMDLMRKQIERRAGERGVSRAQVWDDFVHRRPGGTLVVPGLLGAGAAAYGSE